MLGRPGTELFVALEQERMAGFILLAPYGLAGSPYVASIAVAAEARGRVSDRSCCALRKNASRIADTSFF